MGSTRRLPTVDVFTHATKKLGQCNIPKPSVPNTRGYPVGVRTFMVLNESMGHNATTGARRLPCITVQCWWMNGRTELF